MPSIQKPSPSVKVHVDSEIIQAKTFLVNYRDVYEKDLSDQGLILMLIGYTNYLAASGGVPANTVTGSAALITLKAGGYI